MKCNTELQPAVMLNAFCSAVGAAVGAGVGADVGSDADPVLLLLPGDDDADQLSDADPELLEPLDMLEPDADADQLSDADPELLEPLAMPAEQLQTHWFVEEQSGPKPVFQYRLA